jgi:hypothetical protein
LAFREVPSTSAALEEKIKLAWNRRSFDIVNNFCTYIDAPIRSEFKNMTPDDRQAFPHTVAEYCARIEDKKTFGEFYIVGMTRRFIKMIKNLEEFELSVITAIRGSLSK